MYPEYIELQGNRRSGTLYKELIKLQQENQQLKKQKDDVVEFINKRKTEDDWLEVNANRLLRMLGEIDVED